MGLFYYDLGQVADTFLLARKYFVASASARPEHDRRDPSHPRDSDGPLLVPIGNPSPPLKPVAQPLDPVARPVGGLVAPARPPLLPAVREDRPDLAPVEGTPGAWQPGQPQTTTPRLATTYLTHVCTEPWQRRNTVGQPQSWAAGAMLVLLQNRFVGS